MGGCSLPEDVVMTILSRLPAKSVQRFRCVCKYWCAVIRSPYFIRKHLLHSQSTGDQDNSLITLGYNKCEQVLGTCVLNSDETSASYQAIPNFNYSYLSFFSSCNGILCLSDSWYPDGKGKGEGGGTMLWNPATKEFKTLPMPNITTLPSSKMEDSNDICFGFGFDARTNDYKVVRILRSIFLDTSRPPLVEVYTLGTNSWKVLDCEIPSFMFNTANDYIHTYLNGIYYWWVSDADGEMLLSFDMSDEVLEKTPQLPDCCTKSNTTAWKLTSFKGSVALIVYDCSRNCKCFDIWLLDKHVDNCWVKHSTIRPLEFFRPLGFWLNGEELLGNKLEKVLLSYDPKSQVIRDLKAVYGLLDFFLYHPTFVLYRESLVSLKSCNVQLQSGEHFEF